MLATMDSVGSIFPPTPTTLLSYPPQNHVYMPLSHVDADTYYQEDTNYMLSPLDHQLPSGSPHTTESYNSHYTSLLPTLTAVESLCAYDAQSVSSDPSSPDSETVSPITPTVAIDHSSNTHSHGRSRPMRHSTSAHPYRPPSQKTPDSPESKKRNSRRIWTHALEKHVFSPHEIASLGITHRRTIYQASLEAHIDRLHCQLISLNLFPVHYDELQPYKGLNCKIAKALLAGLQHDYVQVRTNLLEIERATENACTFLAQSRSEAIA